ncbi:MAG: hypothetical protein ACM3TU_02790 [Bacillota bacterium]
MKKSRPNAGKIIGGRIQKKNKNRKELTLEEAWILARNAKELEWRNFALHRLIAFARKDLTLDDELGTFLQGLKSCPLGVVEHYVISTRRPEVRAWARAWVDSTRKDLGMEPRRWPKPQPLKRAA